MLIYDSDIIVIGAGAAGLMAAYSAASACPEAKVVLFEKMPRPGRKIMISGKGRCNFTNVKPWEDFQRHVYPKATYLRPAFYNLPPEKLCKLFSNNGMDYVVERGDRAFPSSHLSSDVVDTLVKLCNDKNVGITDNFQVKSIAKDGDLYSISGVEGKKWQSKKLIIATGGLSYPTTGSSGDGYGWARSFGHSLKSTFPSLTAIVPKGYKVPATADKNLKGHIDRSVGLTEFGSSLCGVKLENIGLQIHIDGNCAADEFGDLDFTDGGIEGPIGFKVSRKCVSSIINSSKVKAVLDLKPAVSLDELDKRIQKLWKEICDDKRSEGKPYKTRFGVLVGKLLPKELVQPFIKSTPDVDHKKLAKALKNWTFEIEGYVGYERCVVTAGGIDMDEINPKTLESKKVTGLYFAGEILNLDADTGGYNLQIAFSTGYLAGLSAARSIQPIR